LELDLAVAVAVQEALAMVDQEITLLVMVAMEQFQI
jgi:hypothetical protein